MVNINKNQIVIMKGNYGFADRLQVLSHCMHYCIKNNASLCVDWRDELWGQEKTDFHDYFELIGINSVSLEEVLDRIKENTSIFPSSWTIKDIADPPNPITQFSKYNYTFDNTYNKLNEEIIIINCHGLRTYHVDNLILNIRLKKDISDIIINRIDKLCLPFTVVHLRGTDRLNKKSILESIQPAIDKFNKLPEYAKIRTYILSDMKEMITIWKDKFPESNILIDDYTIYKIPTHDISCDLVGIHQLDEDILNYYSIEKRDINIDTITDFIIMCYAKWIIGNNDESVFTKLSHFISKTGKRGISKWLYDFELETKAINNIN
jgi:hypothetical protein